MSVSALWGQTPFRWRIRWIAAGGALSLALASSAAAAPVDPTLARLAEKHPTRHVETIVQFRDGVSVPQARRAVRRVGGKPGQTLPLIRGLSAELRARAAVRLTRSPRVRAVTLNAAVKSQAVIPDLRRLKTVQNQSVRAEALWFRGITGEGVGVAVIDTGVSGGEADFATSRWDRRSRVIASVVTHPDATTAEDTYGHGTMVAGLIAGNGAVRSFRDSLYGGYAGTAPGANIIAIKAADEQGNSSVLDVINGLQFVLEHRDELGIRVVNLSLQSSVPGSYKTDPLDAAVEAVWQQGIVVVAAAGNRGGAADQMQYAPGNDPYVITVGALDDKGTKSPADDAVASWSERGTTQDGIVKPEVYAPGTRVVSNLAPGSAFASLCPTCIVDGSYVRASGTSMAAPVVAGVVADLLQAKPELTPDEVKGVLMHGSARSSDGVPAVDASLTALRGFRGDVRANQGLTPNEAAAEAVGDADPTRSSWSRSSWSRSSWSQASGSLSAGWARSSWSCACSVSEGAAVDPTRSSWSRSSWSGILVP